MTGRKRVATAGLTAVLGRNLSGTNLQRAGDHNQRVTLHAIRVSGPVTRTDLVLMTGLTPAAIANITNRLLRQRLIVKSGTVRGGRGQPAVKLSIHPGSCYSLGLHIDRDHITLVLVDFAGKVRARSSREVAFALPETVQTSVRRMAGRLLERARIGVGRVAGLGVAFPDDIQRAALSQPPPAGGPKSPRPPPIRESPAWPAGSTRASLLAASHPAVPPTGEGARAPAPRLAHAGVSCGNGSRRRTACPSCRT